MTCDSAVEVVRHELRRCIQARGLRLPSVANSLAIPVEALEAFVTATAMLVPSALAALTRMLEEERKKEERVANRAALSRGSPLSSTPREKQTVLTAKAIKVTLVLNSAEVALLPEPAAGKPRVVLSIRVGGRTVAADIAAKALRKVKVAIAAQGDAAIAVVLVGSLGAGDALLEAGLSAQVRAPKMVEVNTSDAQAPKMEYL